MIVNFTISDLIKEVRRLANENPDFVYPEFKKPHNGRTCSYLKSEKSDVGCIFGQAILNIQPDLKEFLIHFDCEVDSGIKKCLQTLFPDIDLTYPSTSREQLDWCEKVQDEQDRGSTWGEAIKIANFRD